MKGKAEQRTNSEEMVTIPKRNNSNHNQELPKFTQTIINEIPVTFPRCDCISLGCEPCISHGKTLQKLESEQLRNKTQQEDIKKESELLKNEIKLKFFTKPGYEPWITL